MPPLHMNSMASAEKGGNVRTSVPILRMGAVTPLGNHSTGWMLNVETLMTIALARDGVSVRETHP